jgi:hypothetical protein
MVLASEIMAQIKSLKPPPREITLTMLGCSSRGDADSCVEPSDLVGAVRFLTNYRYEDPEFLWTSPIVVGMTSLTVQERVPASLCRCTNKNNCRGLFNQ